MTHTPANLLGLEFRVIDTAGYEDEDPDSLPGRMRAQTGKAQVPSRPCLPEQGQCRDQAGGTQQRHAIAKAVARDIGKRYRNALRELSKR